MNRSREISKDGPCCGSSGRRIICPSSRESSSCHPTSRMLAPPSPCPANICNGLVHARISIRWDPPQTKAVIVRTKYPVDRENAGYISLFKHKSIEAASFVRIDTSYQLALLHNDAQSAESRRQFGFVTSTLLFYIATCCIRPDKTQYARATFILTPDLRKNL